MTKNIFLGGIIFLIVGGVAATPVRAQTLDIPGSEEIWAVAKGLIDDPWTVFKPLQGLEPAGLDLYGWTEGFRAFIQEFQNSLTVSPKEALNLVLGKTSGIIWLDTLVNYLRGLWSQVF